MCQSQASLEFSSLFCKYESPCPGIDFKRDSGRPHTRPWHLPEPFPFAHQTPADKSSSRWHNEKHRLLLSVCEVWHSVFFWCFVLTLHSLCVLNRQSRHPDTSHWGQAASKPSEFLRSTVRAMYKYTSWLIEKAILVLPFSLVSQKQIKELKNMQILVKLCSWLEKAV